MGNKGALIRFEAPELKPNIVTFSAVVSGFSHLLLLTNPVWAHHTFVFISLIIYSNKFYLYDSSLILMSNQWHMPTTSLECFNDWMTQPSQLSYHVQFLSERMWEAWNQQHTFLGLSPTPCNNSGSRFTHFARTIQEVNTTSKNALPCKIMWPFFFNIICLQFCDTPYCLLFFNR